METTLASMFSKAILDVQENPTREEKRFYSCVSLVADEVIPAVFYINADWGKTQTLEKHGVDPARAREYFENLKYLDDVRIKKAIEDFVPKKPYVSGTPRIVYLEDGSWKEKAEIEGKISAKTPTDQFILSSSPSVNQAALLDQGITANTALLALAATGVDLILPNVSVELLATDEIEELKELLTVERLEYLNAVSKIASESFEALSATDGSDLMNWARNEFQLKIAPKARSIEIAARKQKPSLLNRAGFKFFKNGVPVIGAAALSGGLKSGATVAGAQALASIIEAVSTSTYIPVDPEVSYAVKLKTELDR